MEFLFYFIPKGFLHCQFSIVNCQLNYPFVNYDHIRKKAYPKNRGML